MSVFHKEGTNLVLTDIGFQGLKILFYQIIPPAPPLKKGGFRSAYKSPFSKGGLRGITK